MRFLVVVTALLFAIAIFYLLVSAFTGGGPAPEALEATSRWEAHTTAADGVTTVSVRKIADGPRGVVEFGRQTIAAIPDDDPGWEARYHEAMAEARSRVAALEAQSD